MTTTPYPTLQFGHSETTQMIRETVYQFCQSELMPIADEVDSKNEFPRHLWEKMGALGMHGITVAEEDGGLGLGYLEHTIAIEEVSRASASVGLVLRRAFQPMHQSTSALGQCGAKGQISA